MHFELFAHLQLLCLRQWAAILQILPFCALLLLYLVYNYFTALNKVHVKFERWVLQKCELCLEKKMVRDEFIRMSHPGNWNEKQKQSRWQSALVYLMIPGHKWLGELTGDFILKLTGRFDAPNLVQLIMNTPTFDVIPEYSNIRTWHFLCCYSHLHLDLQYKAFFFLILIHTYILNLLKPKGNEKINIKEI